MQASSQKQAHTTSRSASSQICFTHRPTQRTNSFTLSDEASHCWYLAHCTTAPESLPPAQHTHTVETQRRPTDPPRRPPTGSQPVSRGRNTQPGPHGAPTPRRTNAREAAGTEKTRGTHAKRAGGDDARVRSTAWSTLAAPGRGSAARTGTRPPARGQLLGCAFARAPSCAWRGPGCSRRRGRGRERRTPAA